MYITYMVAYTVFQVDLDASRDVLRGLIGQFDVREIHSSL